MFSLLFAEGVHFYIIIYKEKETTYRVVGRFSFSRLD